jgi:membrane-bound lytic murein transglycosylase D
MESPAGQEKATRPGSELASLNLLADPADYRVNADSTIEVQFGETLGHYAEWLDIRAQELRVRNDLQFGEALPIHSRLGLDFSRVPKAIFEEQRIHFQRAVQGKYFSEWEITGTTTHTLKLGNSIWDLAHQQFKVPLWLLQQYNPDVDFETASAGVEIISPIVERR